MRDFNDTLIFVRVVEQGSFIAAARTLGMPKTTVSRRIQELEQRLGVQLLHRTTRRLGLTEPGALYFDHCQRIARELDEAESAVTQLQSGPRGWLRFTVPTLVGEAWIAPLLGEFYRRYPEVRVEMLLSNEKLDLYSGEIDLALRMGELEDSALIARPLGVFHTQIYATPSYAEQYGDPQGPGDLVNHRILAYSQQRRNGRFVWTLFSGEQQVDVVVEPQLVSNEISGLKGALLCGQGLMMAPDVLCRPFVEAGVIRRVMAGWQGPSKPISAVFPRGHTLSPKVRVFVDFLVERINFDINWMANVCPYSNVAPQGVTVEPVAVPRIRLPEPRAATSATVFAVDGEARLISV